MLKSLVGELIYESHLSNVDKIRMLHDVVRMTNLTEVILYVNEAVNINLLRRPRSKSALKDLAAKVWNPDSKRKLNDLGTKVLGKNPVVRKTVIASVGIVGTHKLLKNIINPCQRVCDGDKKCLNRCAAINKIVAAINRLEKINCNLSARSGTCKLIKEEKIGKLREMLEKI